MGQAFAPVTSFNFILFFQRCRETLCCSVFHGSCAENRYCSGFHGFLILIINISAFGYFPHLFNSFHDRTKGNKPAAPPVKGFLLKKRSKVGKKLLKQIHRCSKILNTKSGTFCFPSTSSRRKNLYSRNIPVFMICGMWICCCQ